MSAHAEQLTAEGETQTSERRHRAACDTITKLVSSCFVRDRYNWPTFGYQMLELDDDKIMVIEATPSLWIGYSEGVEVYVGTPDEDEPTYLGAVYTRSISTTEEPAISILRPDNVSGDDTTFDVKPSGFSTIADMKGSNLSDMLQLIESIGDNPGLEEFRQ